MRYDRPGCGLSERPRPAKWSLQLERDTLHSVMSAAGGTTFDLMGSSLGVPIAIDWAARNPETVNRLILYGGWARGADIATPQVREHVVGLVRSHWGLGSDVLTEIFAPDASAATSAELANYQRQASSAETAAELLLASYSVDVLEALGDITAPTLVLHRDRDRAAPWNRAGSSRRASEGRDWSNSPGDRIFPISAMSTPSSTRSDGFSGFDPYDGARLPPSRRGRRRWRNSSARDSRIGTSLSGWESTSAPPKVTSSGFASGSGFARGHRLPHGGQPRRPKTEVVLRLTSVGRPSTMRA